MYRSSLLKALELGGRPGSRRAPADSGRLPTTWNTSRRPHSGIRPEALEGAERRTRDWLCEMGLIGTGRGRAWKGLRRVGEMNCILRSVGIFWLLY